jgi:cobalt-zinc-cadmium efflux system outer membrane protein
MTRIPKTILQAVAMLFLAEAPLAAKAALPGSLTLANAIERAVRASPRLDAARAGIDAARGVEAQAQLYPNPEIFLDAENVAGTGPYRSTANAELTGGISERIEFGGKRAARQSSAAAERSAAETDLDAARLDLVRDVTIAFAAVVAAQEDVRLARDLEGTARKVLAEVVRRVSAAKDPLFQKDRAEAALTTATLARLRAEQVHAGALQALARFWDEATLPESVDATSLVEAAAPAPLSIYEDRIAQTPNVIRYERLREARVADLNLARAENIPDINAKLGVRRFAGARETALIAEISLPIPVLNQNQGEIARARAEIVRMSAERRRTELERDQQLVAAWTEWQSAWSAIAALRSSALPQAERAFDLALAGFRQGGFRYLDVLDTQRAYFDIRSALAASVARLHVARARVEWLVGHPVHPPETSTSP